MLVVGGVHAVLHGLDRCKHCHERRAQLMSHIGSQALLVLHVLLERRGHLIECLAQLIDLVIAAQACTSGQIAVANLLGRARNSMNRLGKHARHERSDNDRDADRNNRGKGHGVKGLFSKRRICLGEQGIGADGPQLYLSDMLARRRYDFDVGNAIGVGGR